MIAGELKINLPTLSFDVIDNFLNDSENDHYSSEKSQEEKIYEIRNKRKYPWKRRILEFHGKKIYKFKNDHPFYKIFKIIDKLPLTKETRRVLFLYQEHQDSYDFNFHFDQDNMYGFRICYGLDTDNTFLEFSRLKQEIKKSRKKIENEMVDKKVYKLIPKKKDTVFLINGEDFAHRVPLINSSSRAVFIISGDLTDLNNLKFINILKE